MAQTKSSTASKRCRERISTLFDDLNSIIQVVTSMKESNRFRIIERVLAILRNRPTIRIYHQSSFNSRERLSNKDACACYRLRMNALFGELRSELKKEDYVKIDRYKLQTKAGLLLATIDALKVMIQRQSEQSMATFIFALSQVRPENER
ncbi:unnamed protein product [Oikopleura dioica]|uniref:Uncharacterized protein n=1 Tax=Oikopleura dioica TaxID=34765 RepID=E4XRE2_OIKDI|nr:unnamed protein product [Oikopleura dioica]